MRQSAASPSTEFGIRYIEMRIVSGCHLFLTIPYRLLIEAFVHLAYRICSQSSCEERHDPEFASIIQNTT